MRIYTDENGESVIGPEVWHGDQWSNLEQSIPPGGVLLFILIHSDKTYSMKGSRYPSRISLGNLQLSDRQKDAGSRIMGFGPLINIQRQRGGVQHVVLNDAERAAKHAILAATPAYMLADLDEIASSLAKFLIYVPRGGGQKETVQVHCRIGMFIGDYEEQKAIFAIKGDACPRCLFLTTANEMEAASQDESEVHPRPYMRADPSCMCGSADPRTVRSVVKMQAECVTKRRTGSSKEDTESYAKFSGVAMDVECTLHRLTNLLPPALGFPYIAAALDFLHTFCCGVASRTVAMVDALILKKFKKIRHVLISKDDVRGSIDERLTHVPSFRKLLRFTFGWWEASNSDAVSASESFALLCQLPFAYVGDETLIPYQEMRIRLVNLHWLVVCIGRELKTPQWYSENELDDLERRLKFMSDEFQWVMDVLGDDCPGNGMNIIKFHHIMAAVSQIRRFGCVMNADTGIYERLMKFIKSLDERVGRSRDDNGNEECFVRSSVTEADRADQLIIDSTKPASSSSPSSSSSGQSTCEPGKRTKSGNYFIVGSGHAWSSLVNSLVQGSAGPALSDTVIEGALGTLRNRVVDMSTNFFFRRSGPVRRNKLY